MYLKNKKRLLFIVLVYLAFSIQIVYANDSNNLKHFSIIGLSGIDEPISGADIENNDLKNNLGKVYELEVSYGTKYIRIHATPEDEDDIVEIYVDGIINTNRDVIIDDETNIRVVVLDSDDSKLKQEYNIILNRLPLNDNDPLIIFDYMEYTDEINDSANRIRENIYTEETKVIIDESTNTVGIDLYVRDRVEDVTVKFNGMILDYNVMDYGYLLEMGNKNENQFIIELLGEDGKTKIYKIIFVKDNNKDIVKIGDINHRLDGEIKYSESKNEIYNSATDNTKMVAISGKSYLPLRAFVEDVLDGVVYYDGDTKNTTVTVDNQTLDFSLEHNDLGSIVINGTTYLPIRSVCESLGMEIVYNSKDRSVHIYKTTYIIEHSATIANKTNKVIDEVYLIRDEDSRLLVSNVQPNSSEYVTWNYEEEFLLEEYDASLWGSPYFVLVVDGEKIPVMTAKMKINEANEQLYVTTDWVNSNDDLGVTSDTIAFFEDNGDYYYSPQYDYLTRVADENVNYLYIPQLESWLRQRDNQVLFASSLGYGQFKKYFKDYKGEIPRYMPTAVVTTEPIYLEDVSVEANSDYSNYREVRNSNKTKLFTPNDVMIVSADSVRNYELYFKFVDDKGVVHREYVSEQGRDSNNGGIVMCIVGEDDINLKLID